MQIFANSKQHFDSFMAFYVMHVHFIKYQGVKISTYMYYHFKCIIIYMHELIMLMFSQQLYLPLHLTEIKLTWNKS